MKQAKYLPLLLLAAGLGPLQAAPDPSHPTPPPALVQARVFRNLQLQDFTLDGDVHNQKKSYPIQLKTHDREMVYLFKDQPLQIRVDLNPAVAVVQKRRSAKEAWQTVSGAALKQTILDTDVAYEDLGLSFIFWDNMKGLGSDDIKTLPAWAFEATPPPDFASLYTKVRYWISSEYYAFLRVDGYNRQGQVIKRVEINGVRKIGEAYVVNEIQVSTMVPGTDVSSSRTYIDVASGTPGSGL
jgi:hypothetical protein